MAISIILPAQATIALDPDVVAAWAGTDRPTMQALLAAGLPIPLEDTTSGDDADAIITGFQQAGLMAVAFRGAQPPRQWLKASAILLSTAVIFHLMSRGGPMLMDLSSVPAMAGLYTLALAGLSWAWQRREAEAMQKALDTATRHLTTAAPVGPCAALIHRIRALRREVVSAGLSEDTQGELLSVLFDLEISQSTIGTLPLDASEAISEIKRRLQEAAALATA